MEQQGVVRRPIERSIVLGGTLLVLVLVVILSVISCLVLSSAVYERYDVKLKNVITFVENNADADDLAHCVKTGTHSQKYDELQRLLNGVVDDFELEYLYIVIPSKDTMTNVISATSAAERAMGEVDMPLLEVTDAYSPQELARYMMFWNADSIGYFEETSDYGSFYTAIKPLRDSSGRTVALICADLSSEALRGSLVLYALGSTLTAVLLLGIVARLGTSWIRKNITRPLSALERSARDFANKSHDESDVGKLQFVPPAIHTQNEIESLSMAIAKVATDVRTHVGRVLVAQEQANEMQRRNLRLEEEAKSAAKIAELSESVNSLFANIPGLTFSKDARTGTYLACNQAFAEFAHKDSPEEVVGLRDTEMFDPVTAQHFMDDDYRALQMDEPYVFYEDVLDAMGEPRQFQTTKMKFYDTRGRLCTLGMGVDITELNRAKQNTLKVQQAYEEAREQSITFHSIARALSGDYLSMYYVDLDTGQWTEYRQGGVGDGLVATHEGANFFELARQAAQSQIYAADLDGFLEAFTKDNVLRMVEERGAFTLSYRLVQDGNPTYMGMKASLSEGDRRHLVVGVSNIDAQMRRQEAMERVKEERTTYARVTALSGDFLVIYTVDPDTSSYVEFSVSSMMEEMNYSKKGDDFFRDARRASLDSIHEEDLGLFWAVFNKDNVLSEINKHGMFMVNYRLLYHGSPLFVSMRAVLVEERDGPQLIVGVINVDAQVKRDMEYALAKSIANKDALTGLRNKHAYVDAELKLNQRIEKGEAMEFALVVCDINDLKLVNDTWGHQAGDRLIREACSVICNVFKHSPVFRIGGDEFVAIMEGHDYVHAPDLLDELASIDENNLQTGGVVVAWGLSVYQPGDAVADVFSRADEAMYENKRQLKAIKAALSQ